MLNTESKFYDNDDLSDLSKSYLVVNGETVEVVRLGKAPELPFDVAQAKAEEEIYSMREQVQHTGLENYLMKNGCCNND